MDRYASYPPDDRITTHTQQKFDFVKKSNFYGSFQGN